jgi:hypothetical protein
MTQLTRSQSMTAVGLEVVPGLFGFWGIGHLYAGRVGTGLALMVSYWVLQAINAALVSFFGLGILTGGLTFLGYLVFCPTNVLSSRSSR